MSTTAELIAAAEDLWPADAVAADPLDALVRASNLLGAAEDPVAAHRASGYAERAARARQTQQELTR